MVAVQVMANDVAVGMGGAGGWANPELKLAAAHVHNGFPLSPVGQMRTVMITGDYAKTAKAIAETIGLLRPGKQVLTGAELNKGVSPGAPFSMG